jgi:hypothetical protein
MRTTLTLEPDVAALVKRAMRERKAPLKQIVNDAIRAGLNADRGSEGAAPYTVKPLSVGKLLIKNLDNVWGVLDELEGSDFKLK